MSRCSPDGCVFSVCPFRYIVSGSQNMESVCPHLDVSASNAGTSWTPAHTTLQHPHGGKYFCFHPFIHHRLPSQLCFCRFHRSGDAALIGGANAGGLKAENMAADFADCYAGFGFNIFADVIFAGIGALIAIVRPHACSGRTDLATPQKPPLLTFFTFLAFGFIIITSQNFSKVTVQISIFDWMV
jgi:hypothetical protein